MNKTKIMIDNQKKASAMFKIPDESPHYEQPVEWWFIHGHYSVQDCGKRYFMVSLFRQHRHDEVDRDVHYALQTVFDEKSGQCTSHMFLHKDTWDFALRYRPEENHDMDSFLIPLCLNELKHYGPPPSIIISEQEVVVSQNPLMYQWQDFCLTQRADGICLAFLDPFSQEKVDIHLTPQYPRLDLNALGMTSFEKMSYFCYPRMRLQGRLAEKDISGEAWFDHQFGQYRDMFLTFRTDKILGWDWLSANLDDGTDILLMIHREMKSRAVKHQGLLVKKPGKAPEVFNQFNVEVVASWESAKTHIVYPVVWKITVPGRDISFIFSPDLEDQEIAYPGPARAIWEGVGRIQATVDGQVAQGSGRLELYGYGYVFDIKTYMDHFIKRFDKHIEDFFPRELNDEILEGYLGPPQWKNTPEAYKDILTGPIWDLMSRKGKHWRPIFGVLFLDSLGHPSRDYEGLLSTLLELNHTGALIIDDIEDNSLLRRGDKSIHLKYGTDVAINAGNTLYFLPYIQVCNHPHLDQQQKYDIYRIMVKVWVKSHFGQSLDIYWSRYLDQENLSEWSNDSLEERILQMYSYKTSSAVEAVGEAVCIIARSDAKTREAYMSLGRIFGTAFQIIDDINNFNNTKEWRKKCGEDLAAGKVTYVVVRALKSLAPDKKQRLIEIITSPDQRNDPDILAEGIHLIYASGALEACRQEAQEMIEKEWRSFSRHVSPSDAKMMIKMLISGLTHVVYES